MELYNADTGKLLCAHYPEYGQTHQVHQAWSLSQIIIYITGVWWARLPCYPALSLGFSRGVSPIRRTNSKKACTWKRNILTTFSCHCVTRQEGLMSPVFLPFNANLTSIKRLPGPQSINHRFHLNHPYCCSLPHDPCSPGTTTRGATTARWPLGRWGACWPSFRLKSETEM